MDTFTSNYHTGSVTIWKVDSLRSSNVKSFTFNTGHNAPITAIRFEKNGRLVTWDAAGYARVWNISLNSAILVNEIGQNTHLTTDYAYNQFVIDFLCLRNICLGYKHQRFTRFVSYQCIYALLAMLCSQWHS